MAKRPSEFTEGDLDNLKNGERAGSTAKLGEATTPVKDGMGEFEDPYEDEMESDEDVVEAGSGSEVEEDEDEDEEAMDVDTEAYRISKPQEPLGKDEVLEPDPSAFHMLHNMGTKWPCLSFDVLPDRLGDNRQSYPATMFLVTGTQASKPKDNEITVMKLSGLSRMKQDPEDDDDEESDSDDEDSDAILESRHIPVSTTTNRIRLSPHSLANNEYLAATMLETGSVNLYNITPHFNSLDSPGNPIPPAANQPLQSLNMHRGVEGYAIDWSPLIPQGRLLTGDNSGKIFHTTRNEGGKFVPDSTPFTGHTSSIEELQWSPAERTVFASASADGTVKIWDVRQKNKKCVVSVDVSSSDVNVASWNPTTQYLLATGADDGVWAVWDLRNFSAGGHVSPVASFAWHSEPITSVEWNPNDDTVVAVGSADGTVTLWNLAVEEDSEEGGKDAGAGDAPDQLMFEHYCEGVKEVHWMKQMPGTLIATGEKGFSVFKTISV